MNLPFEVRYLPTAEKDLNDILDYILKDNLTAAATLLAKFDKSIGQLACHPEMGTIPRDKRLSRLGYRMLVIGKYLVFYVVKPKTIQIRRIIHGARRYRFLYVLNKLRQLRAVRVSASLSGPSGAPSGRSAEFQERCRYAPQTA